MTFNNSSYIFGRNAQCWAKMRVGSEFLKINRNLFGISLGFHYLCTYEIRNYNGTLRI